MKFQILALVVALPLPVTSVVTGSTGVEPDGMWGGGKLGYLNRGIFVELTPDQALLSVRSRAESPDSITSRLSDLGYPEFRFSETLRRDQYLFSRSTASGTPLVEGQSIETVVATLARVVDGFVSPVFLGNEPSSLATIRPELFVRFREGGSDIDAIRSLLEEYGTIVEEEWALWKLAFRVALHTRSGIEALEIGNTLARREDTMWARASRSEFGPGPSTSNPDDPYFESHDQWGVNHLSGEGWGPLSNLDVNGPEAWATQTGHSCVVALVMDNGVQRHIQGDPDCNQNAHPDLSVGPSQDFTDHTVRCGGAPTGSCDNHGTWVAGVVRATINNDEGVVGVAPTVTLASARVFGVDESTCDDYEYVQEDVTAALAWAQDLFCAGGFSTRVVTNFSANPNPWQPPAVMNEDLVDKYIETWKLGFVHFVSAGNEGIQPVRAPGVLWVEQSPGVLVRTDIDAVNAVTNLTYESADSQPHRKSDSNYGTDVDFTAPGTAIMTTDRSGTDGVCKGPANAYCLYLEEDYGFLSGTSFASPMAAGVAALVLSENPKLSAQAVEWVLRETADRFGAPGHGLDFGWGLPKADAAVALAADLLFFDGFETGTTECWNGSTTCSGGN